MNDISDYDECSSLPCAATAICVDGVNKYSCECLQGYTGESCNEGENKQTDRRMI